MESDYMPVYLMPFFSYHSGTIRYINKFLMLRYHLPYDFFACPISLTLTKKLALLTNIPILNAIL